MEEVQPLPEPVPQGNSSTRFAVIVLLLLSASLFADWWFLIREPYRPRAVSPEEKAARDARVSLLLSRARPLVNAAQAREAVELAREALSIDPRRADAELVLARAMALTDADPVLVDEVYARAIDLAPTLVEARLERMRREMERYLERSALIAASPEVLPPQPDRDESLVTHRRTLLSDVAAVSAGTLSPADRADVDAVEAFLTRKPIASGRGWLSHCLSAWREIELGEVSFADEVVHASFWQGVPSPLPAWVQFRMRRALGVPREELLRDISALTTLSPRTAIYWVDRSAVEASLQDARQDLMNADEPSRYDPVIRVLLAETFLARGHPSEAASLLQDAMAKLPDAPGLYLMRARIHEKLGRLVPARDDYETARRLGADRGDVRAARATFLLRTGQVDEALSDMQQAVFLDSSAASWAVLGEALIEHGEPEAALKQLEGRDGACIHVTRSRALRALGKYKEALVEAEGAHDPASLALCYLGLGDLPSAREAISHGNLQEPSVCETWARLWMVEGSPDEALCLLNSAVVLDPLRASAHALRGQALLESGMREEALAAFTHSLSIDPTYALALRGQAEVLLALGELERARKSLDLAVFRAGKDPRCWNLRAEARRRLRDSDGAIADLTQSLKLDPSQTDLFITRGELFLDAGDLPKARSDADAAVKALPKDARAHTLLAGVALAEGKASESEQALTEALKLDPKCSPALVAKAQLALSRKDRTGALTDLDNALSIDADSADALYLRGKLSVEEAHWEEAARDLARLLLKHPDDSRTLQVRAWLDLARTGMKQR